MKKLYLLLAVSVLLIFCGTAFAHQPRIPEGNETIVSDPEISKAYYSKLDGNSHTYTINSQTPFFLYVNILAPDIPNQKKDLYVEIIKDGNLDNPIGILDGNNFKWELFFEPFGHDSYWMGPEYESNVEPGEYQIIVSSENNDTKYSLATGKVETFDFKESMNAYKLIPTIKKDFFNKSPIDFILSPLGWGLIIIMYILAFIFGFTYRFILKRITKNKIRKRRKNIGKTDRLLRLIIAIGLLLLAIFTTWSPILLFFSGFTLFEAIFSWCGFYAAIGKNSCPL